MMTRLPHRATALVMIALLVAPSTACRSMRELPAAQTAPSQPPTWQVKPGDIVRVTLAGGQRVQFEVAAVEEDALVADNGNRYPNTDIRRLERRQFSGRRTIVLVLVVSLAGLALAVAAAAASFVPQ